MSSPLHVVVHLHAGGGGVAALRAWERCAVEIMRRHGARLRIAFEPEPAPGRNGPDEIHVIEFPDRRALEAYRADPAMAALADGRAEAVARSELFVSRALVDYG